MQQTSQPKQISWRITAWYACLLLVLSTIIIRLFYIQVIRHDDYKKAAATSQFKEREIAAERGIIEARSGDDYVQLVLNEKKYTLFADPFYIVKPDDVASEVQKIIGGETQEIVKKLTADSRYQVLAKKLDKSTKERIDALEIKGVGTREESYRTYPQGSLGAQILGFVNDEAVGMYGVEQSLDEKLKGKTGQLRAITDASGVPLVANEDNVVVDPERGARVSLSIDVGLQQRVEEILKEGLDDAKSSSGSLLVIDPNTGAVKAMANYPTFNPSEFYNAENPAVFTNPIVSEPMEVGSIVKPLVVASALDQGVINENWSYFDEGTVTIDGKTIKNVAQNYGNTALETVLRQSLNTGTVELLKQMGGGDVNEKARVNWHEYLVNHYRFGKVTGIEQGYEAAGSVPEPQGPSGINIQYATTTFGQGMNITVLQIAAAFASVINGGNYYEPFLVEKVTYADGRVEERQPRVARSQVVSQQAGNITRSIMERTALGANRPSTREGYIVGGKTGTAQVPRTDGGGYDENKINGTYIGYVGGDKPEYVIVVRVNDPKIGGLAGSRAAAPIFANTTNMLIDTFGVTPKTK